MPLRATARKFEIARPILGSEVRSQESGRTQSFRWLSRRACHGFRPSGVYRPPLNAADDIFEARLSPVTVRSLHQRDNIGVLTAMICISVLPARTQSGFAFMGGPFAINPALIRSSVSLIAAIRSSRCKDKVSEPECTLLVLARPMRVRSWAIWSLMRQSVISVGTSKDFGVLVIFGCKSVSFKFEGNSILFSVIIGSMPWSSEVRQSTEQIFHHSRRRISTSKGETPQSGSSRCIPIDSADRTRTPVRFRDIPLSLG